ncbi:hypothetical protein TW95_gp0189 [Pandoravirus inopinatum]|uniref:Uncharacterized protein n=1 Tax=Pandoravirus inopinatum TaxID=1605721 RepID=A0A0B5IW60_9VIRU|nr:hypothetical protein TW95_gp0189 [Pandoravirus inopinatum]AJF96923.1 hypothetical protein [Pandoravirus inopinatum]
MRTRTARLSGGMRHSPTSPPFFSPFIGCLVLRGQPNQRGQTRTRRRPPRAKARGMWPHSRVWVSTWVGLSAAMDALVAILFKKTQKREDQKDDISFFLFFYFFYVFVFIVC